MLQILIHIQDKLYDDFSFTFIMNHMRMDEKKDVKWIEPREHFDDEEWEYFLDDICCNCQKLIVTRQKNLSKTNDLLRCLRNCIAHGHFAIVEDYIIGFNKKSTKNNPDGIKKAVVKIKPKLLLEALKSLTSPIAKEILLEYAFKRIGYNVVRESGNQNFRFDLVIEKNNRKYVIEVKDYRGISYLHPEQLKGFLIKSAEFLPDMERVLFIDTSRVTKAVREWEAKNENFRIINLTQVKQLLMDPPVDILEETR